MNAANPKMLAGPTNGNTLVKVLYSCVTPC